MSPAERWSLYYVFYNPYKAKLLGEHAQPRVVIDMRSHDDVIKWKHFPRYWPFVRGIPVDSPHKGQWRGALMFSLICPWINGRANNQDARDLRRHRAHYDVAVMCVIGTDRWYPYLSGMLPRGIARVTVQQPWRLWLNRSFGALRLRPMT